MKNKHEFKYVTSPIVNHEKMKSFYGIDIIGNKAHNVLIDEYGYWINVASLHSKYKVFEWEPEKSLYLNRFAFEMFLNAYNRLPINFAAAQLGMTIDSVFEVMVALWNPRSNNNRDYVRYKIDHNPVEFGYVHNDSVRNISKHFEEFKSTIFSDHTSFCDQLHSQIEKRFNGLKIKKRRCIVASKVLNEEDYSFSIDLVTDQPVGLRYRIALNNQKPLILEQDYISLGVYAQNSSFFEEWSYGPSTRLSEVIYRKVEKNGHVFQ